MEQRTRAGSMVVDCKKSSLAIMVYTAVVIFVCLTPQLMRNQMNNNEFEVDAEAGLQYIGGRLMYVIMWKDWEK
jgi:hypothetical protein